MFFLPRNHTAYTAQSRLTLNVLEDLSTVRKNVPKDFFIQPINWTRQSVTTRTRSTHRRGIVDSPN